MPAGLSFGRLRPENAAQVADEILAGKPSQHLRGRTTLAEPLQAAEALLTRELGLRADALRLVRGVEAEDGRWRARFANNGSQHDIVVEANQTGQQVHLSCGDEKTGPIIEYKLLEHKAV